MKITALDISLTCTGVTAPNRTTYSVRSQFGAHNREARLFEYVDRIGSRFAVWRPDIAVIEDYGGGPGGRLKTNGLAELHGALKVTCHVHLIKVIPINPATLKAWAAKVIGRRVEHKTDMIDAAVALGYQPANDDEADAALLHAMGVQFYEPRPEWPELSAKALEAAWPNRWEVAHV